MSLDVSDDVAARVAADGITDEEFVEIIRTSLPDGFAIVEELARRHAAGEDVAIDSPPTMPDSVRLQLLRLFASTSMRHALENHFGFAELGFQNCHAVGAASLVGLASDRWMHFTSARGQILAQKPGLRDC